MAEEFVRKDVYEADMRRIETLMEKTLLEMRADNDKLRNEVNGAISELRGEMQTGLAKYEAIALETRGEVRALAAHIDSLEFWGAIIIGVAAVFFGLAQYFQSKRETIAAEVKEQVRELRKTVLELVEAGKIASARA